MAARDPLGLRLLGIEVTYYTPDQMVVGEDGWRVAADASARLMYKQLQLATGFESDYFELRGSEIVLTAAGERARAAHAEGGATTLSGVTQHYMDLVVSDQTTYGAVIPVREAPADMQEHLRRVHEDRPDQPGSFVSLYAQVGADYMPLTIGVWEDVPQLPGPDATTFGQTFWSRDLASEARTQRSPNQVDPTARTT